MKIMIGLSGGVDSAVSAYLLKKQGHEVIGGFMRNWDSLANQDILGNPTLSQDQCSQELDYQDAVKVAKALDIPLYRIDFIKEYWDLVFKHFLEEYKLGRTPNPDLFCNKYIKFDAFKTFALSHGVDAMAMGHYARRVDRGGLSYLYKGRDQDKDQSYFLSQISQEQLAFTLFPVGEMTKSDVRAIAKKLKLSVATKKNSTGICFIGERHFKEFLKNYIPAQKGPMVDIATNQNVGQHEGVYYYTIGQRKGLGIGGIKGLASDRWFVVKKDVKKNILYVSSGSENEYLLADKVTVSTLNWIATAPTIGATLSAKFRYRQRDLPVKITALSSSSMTLTFEKPYAALTPGQAAVLYEGDRCLGGGVLEQVYYRGKMINS